MVKDVKRRKGGDRRLEQKVGPIVEKQVLAYELLFPLGMMKARIKEFRDSPLLRGE